MDGGAALRESCANQRHVRFTTHYYASAIRKSERIRGLHRGTSQGLDRREPRLRQKFELAVNADSGGGWITASGVRPHQKPDSERMQALNCSTFDSTIARLSTGAENDRLKCSLMRLERNSRVRGSASSAIRPSGKNPSEMASVGMTKNFLRKDTTPHWRVGAAPAPEMC